ncbi:MAG: CpaF family protein [bacterium]
MGLLEHMKREKIPEQEKGSNASTDSPYSKVKEKTHEQLLNVINTKEIEDLPPEKQDEAVRSDVAKTLDDIAAKEGFMMSQNERESLIKELIDRITGLGPLQKLVERDDVNEIMVNGPDEVYIEPRDGEMHQTDVTFEDDSHVRQVINKIVRPIGRRVDEQQPYVDARLQDGSRVNIIIPPLIDVGPTITIRDFKDDPFSDEDLIDFGTMDRRMADFFEACVKAKMNMVISGGTGSGKTTTLNVISNYIPKTERIITIEDTRELQLQKPHVLQCESRPPNIEGEGEVTIRELVENSLRMRPDRILIGECRGPEALDMLQAMNTGHEGSLTTVHSNSPRDAVSRLGTLVMMAEMNLPEDVIKKQIANAVDVIIQQDRMQDGSRKITKVSEVIGMEGENVQMSTIFEFKQEDFEDGKVIGNHTTSGVKPTFHQKFERLGLEIDSSIYVGT